jgi:uncharacterized protein
MSGGFTVRDAVPSDAPLLARHRVGMCAELWTADTPPADVPRILAATERLLRDELPAGLWAAWIAEDGTGPLGSGAAMLRLLPPRPGTAAGGEEAYLLSFFTEPAARRRGVAAAVMRAALAWCRARGVARITLHASEAGRRVYARQGFVPRPGEMIWDEAAASRCGSSPAPYDPPMDGHRLTNRVLRDEPTLRAMLGEPNDLVRGKVVARLTPLTRRFIELSPFVCLATSAADGGCDVSPRGDPSGFVRVLDDATLLIPDRPGNRLADSLRNILSNPHVALLFVVPGVVDSFRVDGRATITDDPDLLAPSAVEGRAPRLGILVDIEHCYAQCGKAFLRSQLWDPSRHVDPSELPTSGALHAERLGPGFDECAYEEARAARYARREGFY